MTALALGYPKSSASWIVNFKLHATDMATSRQFPTSMAGTAEEAAAIVTREYPRAVIIDVRSRHLTVWKPEA